ncbi:MAG: hypothetical protein O3A00_04810 [Planctomycetota bacterium]|nr:hypothetical protein [Planctomycetota bacterium]
MPSKNARVEIDGKTWNVLIDDLRVPVGLLLQPGRDPCLAIDGECGWVWSFGRIHENCSVDIRTDAAVLLRKAVDRTNASINSDGWTMLTQVEMLRQIHD